LPEADEGTAKATGLWAGGGVVTDELIIRNALWVDRPGMQRHEATMALGRIIVELDRLREVGASARVVVREWRQDNPFVGLAIEQLERDLGPGGERGG
jgi:hypothetical protein